MPDIALHFNEDTFSFDLALADGAAGRDLCGDDGLLTAVVLSLFTDARAHDDDTVPDARPGEPGDRRGWWGDALSPDAGPLGSRLWLLWREKDQDEVVIRAQEYARAALAWLVTDAAGPLRVARLEVRAARVAPGYLGIAVQAALPGVQERELSWNFMYDYVNAHPVRITAPGL